MTYPGILRRLASMLYESLLLVAVLFLAGFLFVGLTQGSTTSLARGAFQIYLLGVVAAYFIWFWLRGGQTLAMKTWHLRLVNADGAPLTLRQALLRFALALPGILLGVGILWALFDHERQFLHDRLSKTKIILIN
ncbi:MAG: RDD family protein [Sulfuricella sp.]